MKTNRVADQSQELDMHDYEALLLAVIFLLKAEQKRWKALDGLYSDRFYQEQEFARFLRNSGQMNEEGLKRAWEDIDNRAERYDERCMRRFQIVDYLKGLAERLRTLATAKEAFRAA